jgi:hypothetical protein
MPKSLDEALLPTGLYGQLKPDLVRATHGTRILIPDK